MRGPRRDINVEKRSVVAHHSSSPTIFRFRYASSRNNINPHSRTFSIGPASAANASGFLQVSLSKIRGHAHQAFTSALFAAKFPMNANDYSLIENRFPSLTFAVHGVLSRFSMGFFG